MSGSLSLQTPAPPRGYAQRAYRLYPTPISDPPGPCGDDVFYFRFDLPDASGIRFKLIAEPVLIVDVANPPWVQFDLAAQLINRNAKTMDFPEVSPIPQRFEQSVVRDGLPFVSDKMHQAQIPRESNV